MNWNENNNIVGVDEIRADGSVKPIQPGTTDFQTAIDSDTALYAYNVNKYEGTGSDKEITLADGSKITEDFVYVPKATEPDPTGTGKAVTKIGPGPQTRGKTKICKITIHKHLWRKIWLKCGTWAESVKEKPIWVYLDFDELE